MPKKQKGPWISITHGPFPSTIRQDLCARVHGFIIKKVKEAKHPAA